MSDPRPTAPESLLDHAQWIRALARQLVADSHAADDLAQETCVAALERPPADAPEPRRWLAGVLRNLVRQRSRGEGRRRERERAAARPEQLEGADELVARAQVQRQLVEAVLELSEPYRSAVLLRWFEGLEPAAIAARLNVPVATVNSRQQRALALLRTRLDRAHGGDRSAWSALVLPLTIPPVVAPIPLSPVSAPLAASAAAPSIGAVLMNAKLIAAFVIVAAGAAIFVWKRADQPVLTPHEAQVASNPDAAAVHPGEAGLGAPAPGAERKLVEGEALSHAQSTTSAPAAEHASWTVHGRVLDGDALPRAGLRLKASDSAQPIESGNGGRFSFDTRAESGSLVSDDPRWVTVRNGLWRSDSNYEPLVIAAPAIDLAGTVVDTEGRALPNARVVFELPGDFNPRFVTILEATQPRGWAAACDARGAFSFEHVPAIAGSKLRAVLEGYASNSAEAPLQDTSGLEISLARPTVPLQGSVRGRVSDGSGRAVEGARVALGLTSTTTNASGEFAIDLAHAVTSERILAVSTGFRPALMERPGAPGPGVTGWPDFLELRLGAPALSIAGRVVDSSGEPVRGAKLWISDPTPFGAVGAMPASLENLIAGAAIPPQAFEAEMPDEDADHYRDWVMAAGPANALWNWVATDGEGRFEISGLCVRSYKLAVMLETPWCIVYSRPIPAGASDALVRLDTLDMFPKLSGRVISDRGTPIEGVRVQSVMNVVDAKGRVFGGTNEIILVQRGASARTDADGRFELANMPRKGARLILGAESIVPTEFSITPAIDPESFAITVHERCHLQVELLPPLDRADEIAVIDGDGRPLDLLVISGNSTNAFTSMPLTQGRSEVVSTSSQARTLLLLKDGKEIERFALDLAPGDVNLVRR